MEEENTAIYLKGYKEGFHASMKMAWAYANELLISVDNSNKDHVKKFIKRLKS